MSTLVLGKVAAIERSVARAREEFAAAGVAFARDFTRQDAAILNILRGCELALDLANILIRERGLGIPQSGRDSFRLLADAHLIEPEHALRLQRMIGFRNIAVHDYETLQLPITIRIIETHLDEFLDFTRAVLLKDNAGNA